MPIPELVLDTLRRCGSHDPLGDELRRSQRFPMGTSVSVSVFPHDPDSLLSNMVMRVADVSAGGIGLLYVKPLVIGSEVTVTVENRQFAPAHLRCIVVSCKSVADSMYRIGLRFEHVEE